MKCLKFFALALLSFFVSKHVDAQLLVNEVSPGGASGQYIELVVTGVRTCNDTVADIRNWIVDDNNGWVGTGPGQGIETGCIRFAVCPVWSSVPYGSIILLYDDAHKNTSITLADDPTDADHDHVYVVPISSLLMEKHTTMPSAPSSGSFTYPTTGYTQQGDWSLINMTSAGDAVMTVSPANYSAAYFSLAYGAVTDSANATVYNAATGAGKNFCLMSGQYNSSAAWMVGLVPADETPGAPNSASNAAWINGFRFPITPQTIVNTVIGCNSAVVNGVTYTSSTTLNDTVPNIGGCDSVYMVTNIIIKNVIPTYQEATFWVCRSVVYNGVTYTASTDVTDTLHSSYGCDSVYRLTHINIQNIAPVIQTVFLSDCKSVTYNGMTFTSTTNFRDSVKSMAGCDSVFRIVSIRIAPPPTMLSSTITGCGSVVLNNVTYTDSIILRDTLHAASGCDSVIKVTNINVKKVVAKPQSDTLHGCNTLSFLGINYTVNSVVLDTLRTPEGCDSIYRTTNILVDSIVPVDVYDTLTGCSSVTYNGTVYNASTVIDSTIKSLFLCDSVYKHTRIIIKSVVPVTHSTTLTGCNRVDYNGTTYTTSSVVRDTVQTAEGCDSIYNVTNIQIRVVTTTLTSTFTSCSNVFINGHNYTNSTVITDTIRTAAGCDSIYKITNIDIQNHPVTQPSVRSGCGSVLFNGATYTASTQIRDTLHSVQYCDSVYRVISIVVKNITPVNGTSAVTGCNSVVFNGVTYTTSAVVKDTLRTPEGCDSVYRTNTITVVPVVPVRQNSSFTGCGSYTYHGITYTTSTALTDTIRSVGGCDSVYNLVNINIPVATSQSATVAGCSSVVFHGVTYTSSTVVHDTVKTVTGCDSIYLATTIDIHNVTPVPQSITITDCSSVYYDGVTYASSTTVLDTIRTSVGCDSLYLTVHIVIDGVPVTQTVDVHGCGSAVFNGITYTSPAVLFDTLHSMHGCDSVYRTINISIQHLTPVAVSQTLFGCNNVSFNGSTYNASTVVLDTLHSAFGCDSVYRTTTITVHTISPTSLTTTLTGCNSLVFHGTTYTLSATVTDTLHATTGCDSVYNVTNINIIHLAPVTQTATFNGCNSYVYNGTTYNASTVLTDTLRSTGGCDSVYKVVTLNIQNIAPTTSVRTFTGCNSVVFNGVTYTTSTVVFDTLRTAMGCDSIYNVSNIFVQHITPVADTATIKGCGNVVFNGVTYHASTMVSDTVRSIAGCDSLYHITNISILNPVFDTALVKGCNSLVFNGNTYTASTTLSDTIHSQGGCDSVYKTTQIVIQHITPGTAVTLVKGCNSVVVNGITYSTSTVLYDTVRTTFGCDSMYNITNIVVQHITPVADTATVKGCGSLLFGGITYTASTTAIDTVRSFAGCDSLYHVTNLSILTPVFDTALVKGCNTLVFNGTTYTASATLNDTIHSSGGCDSVYKITQIVIQHITPDTAVRLFKGCNSVVVNGITYAASTVLYDTLRTTFGCDSVYNITNIVVQHITPVADTASVRGCGSLVFGGVTYTASTTVIDTVRSFAGCDSLYHITKLNILKATADTATLRGCNSLVFHGHTYTTSTTVTDTVRTSWGCDSIYHVTQLLIQHIAPVPQTRALFGCNSYVYNGVTYTASTTVLDTLHTTWGCDSVYRTNNISIQHITPVTHSSTYPGCRVVVFYGVPYYSSVVLRDTLRTTLGCDSVYNINHIVVDNFSVSLNSNRNPAPFGKEVLLTTTASVPYNVVSWTPAALFPAQTVKAQTWIADSNKTITVIATSATGCPDTASLNIEVTYNDNFFVPNTFTPNGDGRNDVFKAYGNNVTTFEMTIFDQWGNAICKTNDFENGWDGRSRGVAQPTGVYMYVMKVTFSSGRTGQKKGSVNLIR